jgi:phage shock protein PspC (stress-responsive transcriptional regulator)
MFEKVVIIGIFLFTALLFCFLIRTLKINTDRQNKKIAGVCAGLSLASDMPAWMVRAFFLAFVLFFGYGLIFYLFCGCLCLKPLKSRKTKSLPTEVEKNNHKTVRFSSGRFFLLKLAKKIHRWLD